MPNLRSTDQKRKQEMQALRLFIGASIGLFLVVTDPVEARQQRSHTAIAEFKRLQPCPATGAPRGKCPGWIIDHVAPLCAGGADHHSNMQWQTVAEAKAKDREERRVCLAARDSRVRNLQ